MNWLSLLLALFKAVDALTSYLKQRQLIDAATADLLLKQGEASRAIIDKANAARTAAGDGSVLDESDPNLRD